MSSPLHPRPPEERNVSVSPCCSIASNAAHGGVGRGVSLGRGFGLGFGVGLCSVPVPGLGPSHKNPTPPPRSPKPHPPNRHLTPVSVPFAGSIRLGIPLSPDRSLMLKTLIGLLALSAAVSGCNAEPASATGHGAALAARPASGEQLATFAGGCFWCMEKPFETVPGVSAVISGYTGGQLDLDPTYKPGLPWRHGSHAESHPDPLRPRAGELTGTCSRSSGGRSIRRTPAGSSWTAATSTAARSSCTAPLSVPRPRPRAPRWRSRALRSPDRHADHGRLRLLPAEDYHQDYYKKSPEAATTRYRAVPAVTSSSTGSGARSGTTR